LLVDRSFYYCDIEVTEGWDAEKIQVLSARPLTAEEAIGTPKRGDYPILKGKEFMLVATFHGYRGQAFTDMPGNFTWTLGDVLALPLRNNFERAVLIASLNAVLRSLKRIEKIVHCRDAEPGRCVTIAGIVHLAGYEQYCFCGH